MPSVAAVCRKLNIDYAPALNGFDIRAGRSVPSIDGVVVCSEHEAAVRTAYARDAAERVALAKQKRLAEAEKLWRELLGALLTRVRLERSYGSGGGGGGGGGAQGVQQQQQQQQRGTAEGEAAAMLAHDAATQGAIKTKKNGGGSSKKGKVGGVKGGRKEQQQQQRQRGVQVEEEEMEEEFGDDVNVEEI